MTSILFDLAHSFCLFECDDRSKRTSQKNKEFRLKQNRYNLGKRLKRREKERKEEEEKKNAERTLDDRKMFTFSSICMHNSHQLQHRGKSQLEILLVTIQFLFNFLSLPCDVRSRLFSLSPSLVVIFSLRLLLFSTELCSCLITASDVHLARVSVFTCERKKE